MPAGKDHLIKPGSSQTNVIFSCQDPDDSGLELIDSKCLSSTDRCEADRYYVLGP
jgi:hypothetical protein